MRSALPSLCLGLALGAAFTWSALRWHAASADTSPPAPAPVTLPAWSWRDAATPPLLPRDTAASAISAWLAQRAPDGRLPAYSVRVASLRALLLRLPAESLPRLLDALDRSASDDDRRLLGTAFSAWTLLDAPAAARWAGSAGEKHQSLAREALAQWLTQAPLAAAEWACSLRDEKLSLALAGQALARLAEENPDRALALALSRGPEFQQSALRAIFGAFGKNDPAGTLRRFAPELWKNGSGFHHLHELLAGWAKQDPSAAIAWLLTQPRKGDDEISFWLSQVADRSGTDRRTVADILANHPGLSNRAFMLRDLVFQWSNEKPAEALAWLNALPDPELRLNLLERANDSYSSDTPDKALPLALALPEGASRVQRLSTLLSEWAQADPDATLSWLRDHGAEPGVATASHAVHAALLAHLAREDPQAALAEYATLADPQARLAAIATISATWGQKDPAAALQWADREREAAGNRHYGGNTDLIYQWSRTDPEAALRWIEDWTGRQPAVMRQYNARYLDALAGNWNEKAPRADTADLYTKIKDPELRTLTLTRHVQEWLTKDPAAARAWLDSHDALSPAQAAALLAPASR